MTTFLNTFRKVGGAFDIDTDGIRFYHPGGELHSIALETAVHPGFMTDADVDGAHIRTLLLTLFFRYMRPMIEAGRVFAAVPPLHRIEVSGSGRRKKEIIYTYSDDELVTTLRRLERSGRSFKEPQRYKGLGEMDAHQLAETTMEPQHRTLRRITLGDEAQVMEAESIFELLMGSSVEPRRDFIVEGARDVDRERIDA